MTSDDETRTPEDEPMTVESESGGLLGVIVTLGVIAVAIVFGDGPN